MKKWTTVLIVLVVFIGFTQCKKEDTSPQYVEKVLYSGDSVRYDFDSLPAPLPDAPPNYGSYYKLVQVYTNYTMTVDYTHILDNGLSETFRCFVRYRNGAYELQGWYKRRKVTGYIIPANREVVIYRTVPYNKEDEGEFSADEQSVIPAKRSVVVDDARGR